MLSIGLILLKWFILGEMPSVAEVEVKVVGSLKCLLKGEGSLITLKVYL